MAKVEPSDFFVLDNVDWQYSFTSIATKFSNNKTFSDITAIGDGVIKPAYADALTYYKKDVSSPISGPFAIRVFHFLVIQGKRIFRTQPEVQSRAINGVLLVDDPAIFNGLTFM